MSDCRDTNAVLGCYSDGVGAPVSVIVTHVHDYKGAPAAIITNLAGVVVAGATLANTTLGACAIASPSVEFNELYDVLPDGTFTRFVRRTITSINALGVPTVTITNLAMDYTTPYTLSATGSVTQDVSCAALTSRGLQTTW
jgi:hypothetical protein